MRQPRSIAVLLSLVALLSAQPAAANDAADTVQAHFDRGVALFEKDDFVGALEAFESADRDRHLPAIVYNIARTRESLGQTQAAIDAYEAYVAEAGAQGEFLTAATVAITSLKARSTKLRIDTDPPAAAVRIDGVLLREASPATVWVLRGNHRIEVQFAEWSAGRDVVASGSGDQATVRLDRPKPPAPPRAQPRESAGQGFDGITVGLGFSLDYSALVVKANREATASADPATPAFRTSSLRFGVGIELGYALSPRSLAVLRGGCGLGSTQKALFSLGTLSLSYAWRAAPRWWISGGGILGSSDRNLGATYSPLFGARDDDKLVLGGSLAAGPALGVNYALSTDEDGQWVASLLPSLLLSTGQGQSTLIVPLVIGRQWY